MKADWSWYKGPKLLGIPVFWGDFAGMACFTAAAWINGVPLWLSLLIGVAAWRALA